MKIAIMTQPLGTNYGGIMQAFALQKLLYDMGHDVTTIDRRNGSKELIVTLLKPFKPLVYRVIGKKANTVMSRKQSRYAYSNMANFVSSRMKLSETINSTKKLKSHYRKSNYDIVIIGSDQVWRPKYSPNINNFFADFVNYNCKVIAYAASFGVDKWEYNKRQTQQCKILAANFDAISVREQSAVTLCSEYLDVHSELVLDPALLITAEEYRKFFFNHQSEARGRILQYILDDSSEKRTIIEEISKKLNKEVYIAQMGRDTSFRQSDNKNLHKFQSVEDWVMSFSEASFVITDSFHGCLFSILFNKPFIAIGNKKRGLSRFQSLLTIFGLENRLVLDDSIDIEYLIGQNIDWEAVNSKLKTYRLSSMKFLTSYL